MSGADLDLDELLGRWRSAEAHGWGMVLPHPDAGRIITELHARRASETALKVSKPRYACVGCLKQFAEGDESLFPEWQHEGCGGLVREFKSPFTAAMAPEVDLLHEEDLLAIEHDIAHCRDIGSTTVRVLRYQMERLIVETRARRAAERDGDISQLHDELAALRTSVVDTDELAGAERESLLEDLRMLMLHINGGPGTSRKPMRLGDGSELSRLEAFIRATAKGKP